MWQGFVTPNIEDIILSHRNIEDTSLSYLKNT
jgi:hypothetical protein